MVSAEPLGIVQDGSVHHGRHRVAVWQRQWQVSRCRGRGWDWWGILWWALVRAVCVCIFFTVHEAASSSAATGPPASPASTGVPVSLARPEKKPLQQAPWCDIEVEVDDGNPDQEYVGLFFRFQIFFLVRFQGPTHMILSTSAFRITSPYFEESMSIPLDRFDRQIMTPIARHEEDALWPEPQAEPRPQPKGPKLRPARFSAMM